MDLQDRYAKQAAGPFDNKFMHSIEEDFTRQKWFQVNKKFENGMTVTKYVPLLNAIITRVTINHISPEFPKKLNKS